MKKISVEEYEQLEAAITKEKESRQASIPNLKGLGSIGNRQELQFIGIKGLSDIYQCACHQVHLKSKKGNDYTLYIPCLSDEGNCPLCNVSKKGIDGYKKEYDEKDTVIVSPILAVNLNQKFNPDTQKFEPIKDLNEKNEMVEIQPTLVKRLNTSKRFYNGLVKFVKENGDISNKVVTVSVVKHINKDGSESNLGTAADIDYSLAFNNMIQPVDVSKFDIKEPNLYPLVEKTADEMTAYIASGSFGNNSQTKEETTTETVNIDSVDTQPVEDLSDFPNVNFIQP
ncbi:MAG: hypothetical protein IKP71_09845 [Candidatus Riflebacteria bacterium]|nr:hypothetical protein [Candidatus Riflebacteria bacterium]